MSFLLFVIGPTGISGAYLFWKAADQFQSSAAFSVRSEEPAVPSAALSAFTQTGASATSDSAILFDYIRSQPLVELIDSKLDFSRIYNRRADDFVFSLGPDPSIEAKLDYWERMISLSLDTASGAIKLDVRAFDPEDARAVAREVVSASSDLVDKIRRKALDDTMRYAREDVAEAELRLRNMRARIREFRTANNIVDPATDIAGRMGVITALQSRLAAELVERELIAASTADDNSARIEETDRRITAIRNLIAAEEESINTLQSGERSLSSVAGELEEMLVDLEFSQDAYATALEAEKRSRAEARRKSRYVAVHIPPTLPQQSLYPRRWLLTGLVFTGLFAAWSVMVLVYYNIRDRS
ncbi:MAG: sugar transporter [Paracoccaceae bacterium]